MYRVLENGGFERADIAFIEICRKADNSAQIVRNSEGGGSWIESELEELE